MDYSIFFSIEAIDRYGSSDEPESCSDADTYLELLSALKKEGDFLGPVDFNKTCLQVTYKSDED